MSRPAEFIRHKRKIKTVLRMLEHSQRRIQELIDEILKFNPDVQGRIKNDSQA